MKIYLSACYRRQIEMQGVARELETFGHEITSRWISEEAFPIEEHRQPVQARARRAQRNLIDLAQSDCLIAFTERSPSGPGRGGRHVELGIALFHTLVEFHPNWEEAKSRFLPPPSNLSLFVADRPGTESLTAKSETDAAES